MGFGFLHLENICFDFITFFPIVKKIFYKKYFSNDKFNYFNEKEFSSFFKEYLRQ